MTMYKLSFYVPESHLEEIKTALFKKGAGRYQKYEQCCWQTLGIGQFRPLANSKPYLGKINQLETMAEYKVEMICGKNEIKGVIQTLIQLHPYEQPAYAVFPMLLLQDL